MRNTTEKKGFETWKVYGLVAIAIGVAKAVTSGTVTLQQFAVCSVICFVFYVTMDKKSPILAGFLNVLGMAALLNVMFPKLLPTVAGWASGRGEKKEITDGAGRKGQKPAEPGTSDQGKKRGAAPQRPKPSTPPDLQREVDAFAQQLQDEDDNRSVLMGISKQLKKVKLPDGQARFDELRQTFEDIKGQYAG